MKSGSGRASRSWKGVFHKMKCGNAFAWKGESNWPLSAIAGSIPDAGRLLNLQMEVSFGAWISTKARISKTYRFINGLSSKSGFLPNELLYFLSRNRISIKTNRLRRIRVGYREALWLSFLWIL